MSMSRDEAVAALHDVEAAQTRTHLARSYAIGSPYLILWGAIWVVGYAMTGVAPIRWLNPIWLGLVVFGFAAGVVLSTRQRTQIRMPGQAWRWWTGSAAIACFSIASYAVMRPSTSAQYQVYPALVVSLAYMLAGTWRLTRYLWIGAAVFILSLIGFFFLAPWLPYWMAAVGGGGLVLGGVWLRQP